MTTREWRHSSYCGEGNSCVGIATSADGTVKIRESDAPDLIVTTTPAKLQAFIQGVKAGEFDHFTESP